MNLQERLKFESVGVLCFECHQKVPFPENQRPRWHVHVDPEFTDDGYLIEARQRTFCTDACMKAWWDRETTA